MLQRLKRLLFGAGRDPFDPNMRHGIALVAFLAWIGIGADGLSSSVYGPEEAYRALGAYHALSPLLALASAFTVMIISLGYNQVIDLFPSGGGGYKVATTLLGPYPGLISGSALLIDYILTITISVAACSDALWSLAGGAYAGYKMPFSIGLIAALSMLNVRGVREPIVILAPIFLGFIVTHAAAIGYGLWAHPHVVQTLVPETADAWSSLRDAIGGWGAAAMLLRAYSLSAGTYTGIEAVSNNVHILAEPRVRTGKMTMMYMAVSLAAAAAGITLTYCLWAPTHIPEGVTLNAASFQAIFNHLFGVGAVSDISLSVMMLLEALLLIIAANAGFLGGPAVLANMAADGWAPHAFSQLSTRLVTQNGVLTMGIAAAAVLWLTHGNVSLLVVLYSVNVFITFTLSLLGLVRYWLTHPEAPNRLGRLLLSLLAVTLSLSILVLMVYEKFLEGAWATIIATGGTAAIFYFIRRHYDRVAASTRRADTLLRESIAGALREETRAPEPPAARDRVAVILVGRSLGAGVHELLTVNRLFPGVFQGFVFVSVGEVDTESFKADERLQELRREVCTTLETLVRYCASRGFKAEARLDYGVDPVEKLTHVCREVRTAYPNAVFFATKLVFEKDSLLLRLLHNQTAVSLQRKLHFIGIPMMVLPMKAS